MTIFVSTTDLGKRIVDVATIVFLNLPNTLDKCTIFCNAVAMVCRNTVSLIILTFSNRLIKLVNNSDNWSAAWPNSVNPLASTFYAICDDSFAIDDAAWNNIL